MRHAVLAGLLVAGAPAVAQPAGAPVAAPMQPGAWGPAGWQPGAAAYAPPPVATAPVPAPAAYAPPPPAYAPAAYAPPPPPVAYAAPVPPRVYDRIQPGRRVRGPALGNTVYDWPRWGLGQPGPGMRWIRYYDDAVLIDARDRAVDVRSVPWNAPRPAPRPAYAMRPPLPPQGAPMRAPGTYVERHGDTVVTTQVLAPPAPLGAMYAGYGQVVSATPGTIVTTTRTYVTGGGTSRHRGHRRRR